MTKKEIKIVDQRQLTLNPDSLYYCVNPEGYMTVNAEIGGIDIAITIYLNLHPIGDSSRFIRYWSPRGGDPTRPAPRHHTWDSIKEFGIEPDETSLRELFVPIHENFVAKKKDEARKRNLIAKEDYYKKHPWIEGNPVHKELTKHGYAVACQNHPTLFDYLKDGRTHITELNFLITNEAGEQIRAAFSSYGYSLRNKKDYRRTITFRYYRQAKKGGKPGPTEYSGPLLETTAVRPDTLLGKVKDAFATLAARRVANDQKEIWQKASLNAVEAALGRKMHHQRGEFYIPVDEEGHYYPSTETSVTVMGAVNEDGEIETPVFKIRSLSRLNADQLARVWEIIHEIKGE